MKLPTLSPEERKNDRHWLRAGVVLGALSGASASTTATLIALASPWAWLTGIPTAVLLFLIGCLALPDDM